LNYPNEEDNCLPCHNGNVAQKNILPEFNKLSVHPAYSSSGMHDAAEEAGVQSRRHAACSDCHNAHAVSDAGAGWLAGALKAIKGVNGSGLAVEEISYEYELCFRCHGDANYAAHSYVDRQFAEDSTRREFDPANRSFHPLENIGKNPDCPSLIAPLTTSSLIKCTDCHNNDAGPGAGGGHDRGQDTAEMWHRRPSEEPDAGRRALDGDGAALGTGRQVARGSRTIARECTGSVGASQSGPRILPCTLEADLAVSANACPLQDNTGCWEPPVGRVS